MVNAIVDIVIVLMLLLGGFIGYKKGFIRSLKRPIRMFGGFILAFSLANPVSIGIIEPVINEPISLKIEEYIHKHYETIEAGEGAGDYPTIIKIAAKLMDIDLSTAESATEIVNSILEPIIHFFAVIIAFVLVYILSKLFLSIIVKLVAAIFDKTILSMPNKIVGCVFCAFASFVFVWMAVSVLDFAVHLPMLEGTGFAAQFTGGPIFRFFLGFSPIDLLLSF